MKRQTHLTAARAHGLKAASELRRAAADSALFWVLGHKNRIAQFRRAVKGTRAERPIETLLDAIREGATPLRHRAPKRRRHVARRRKTTSFSFRAPSIF